jgi:aldose 1-epimerase
MSITRKPFGHFENKEVTAFTLSNEMGMQVTVINYGATITQIITPDKTGIAGNVILGFDSLEGYIQNGHQFHDTAKGPRVFRRAADRKPASGQLPWRNPQVRDAAAEP